MLKAILHNGAIVPTEPLPPEWEEGAALQVDKAAGTLDIDEWTATMDRLCADSLPEEEARMLAAIDEHRRLAKAQTRREMGLPQ